MQIQKQKHDELIEKYRGEMKEVENKVRDIKTRHFKDSYNISPVVSLVQEKFNRRFVNKSVICS